MRKGRGVHYRPAHPIRPAGEGRSPRHKVNPKATLKLKSCPRSLEGPATPSSVSLEVSVFSRVSFSSYKILSLASLLAGLRGMEWDVKGERREQRLGREEMIALKENGRREREGRGKEPKKERDRKGLDTRQ